MTDRRKTAMILDTAILIIFSPLAMNHDWRILITCSNPQEAEPTWRISQTSNSKWI